MKKLSDNFAFGRKCPEDGGFSEEQVVSLKND